MKNVLMSACILFSMNIANATNLVVSNANEAGGGGSVVGNRLLDIAEYESIQKFDLKKEPEYVKYIKPLINELDQVYAYLGNDLENVISNMKWYSVKKPKFNPKICSAKNSITTNKKRVVACQINGSVMVDQDWRASQSEKSRSDLYFHEIMLKLSFDWWALVNRPLSYNGRVEIPQEVVRHVVATILINQGSLQNTEIDTDFMGLDVGFYPTRTEASAKRQVLEQRILKTLDETLIMPTERGSVRREFSNYVSVCLNNRVKQNYGQAQEQDAYIRHLIDSSGILSELEKLAFHSYADRFQDATSQILDGKVTCPKTAREYYNLMFSAPNQLDLILKDITYSGYLSYL